MKFKVSNTLYILSALFLIGGIAFNWFQDRNSVNDSLSKARAEKKRKAEGSIGKTKTIICKNVVGL